MIALSAERALETAKLMLGVMRRSSRGAQHGASRWPSSVDPEGMDTMFCSSLVLPRTGAAANMGGQLLGVTPSGGMAIVGGSALWCPPPVHAASCRCFSPTRPEYDLMTVNLVSLCITRCIAGCSAARLSAVEAITWSQHCLVLAPLHIRPAVTAGGCRVRSGVLLLQVS
jgi:hypothetical protein